LAMGRVGRREEIGSSPPIGPEVRAWALMGTADMA
jgi:hypothetical protein